MSNPQYAPNPKNQKVYRNLQNKKLSDVTAKDIQQLTDPTFIQATNQDALITYNMLNKAMMRDGMPMPHTSKIVTGSVTGSSQNVTLFTPAAGEVWSIQGFAQNKVGTFSAAVTGYLILDDGNQTTTIDMVVRRISSSTADPQEDSDFGTPVFVDQNMTVKYRAYSTGFGDSVEGQIYCIRVR